MLTMMIDTLFMSITIFAAYEIHTMNLSSMLDLYIGFSINVLLNDMIGKYERSKLKEKF